MSIENSGDSCNYYVIHVKYPCHEKTAYTAECIDIMESLDMTPHEANIFKEVWRMAAARQGRKKKGHSYIRGAEKLVFFSNRILTMECNK